MVGSEGRGDERKWLPGICEAEYGMPVLPRSHMHKGGPNHYSVIVFTSSTLIKLILVIISFGEADV